MIDYHIHTTRCGHAEGKMSEYVRQALQLSFLEIGFADHLPLLTKRDPSLTMSEEQLGEYIQAIEWLKEQFPSINIRAGIEADYFPGLEKETASLLSSYDFDYVIGSVHFIDGWGFDDSRYIEGYKSWNIYDLYAKYFELVASAASTGLFDIIGHLDLIKKYNFRPEEDITPLVKKTLKAIKDAGVCIEINTAGLRKPVGEIYPSIEILRLCHKEGVPITLGSDAHSPEHVGMDFDLAIIGAKQAGYSEIAMFKQRQRNFIKLR
ncbi:MAG: histidinol-phosphatase HisJ [Actinomycetota bacterium]|nr:histidinol-phosphatase HisJ [Actinomycetota bacterium]